MKIILQLTFFLVCLLGVSCPTFNEMSRERATQVERAKLACLTKDLIFSGGVNDGSYGLRRTWENGRCRSEQFDEADPARWVTFDVK